MKKINILGLVGLGVLSFITAFNGIVYYLILTATFLSTALIFYPTIKSKLIKSGVSANQREGKD